MPKLLLCFLFLIYSISAQAQFAPPANNEGSTAIFVDSLVFSSWANSVVVERGYVKIDEPTLGFADYGIENNALGKADNLAVSLGDGGIATYSFYNKITNGAGPDFAIFENSFTDDFLELCFVEVSSDGENFFRFNSISNLPNNIQLGGFGIIDARLINNFGGKYRQLYGTPFDLEELKNEQNLDINQISHVRVIDVVGNIDPVYSSYDANGNIINEPWPTPFPSSGFDLDALGIINSVVGIFDFSDFINNVEIFFISSEKKLVVETKSSALEISALNIFSIDGRKVSDINLDFGKKHIDLQFLKNGIYIAKLSIEGHSISIKFIVK